jgi:hypothetical protein
VQYKKGPMLQTIPLSSNVPSEKFYRAAPEDFYQQLKSLSNTIISLQYNSMTFLSFKVHEASRGSIVNPKPNLTIQCQIRGNTYTFTPEHLDQLSNRECTELFNELKIDSL